MALMTTAEVKAILGITASTYDTQIATFIPYVEKDIIDYLNNGFQDGYVYRQSGSEFAFAPDTSTGDYITDGDSDFLNRGFLAGMDIVIEGGYSNTGKYTIASVTANKIVLTDKGTLIAQDMGDTNDDNQIGNVKISRVKWPIALKIPAAKMVWNLIDDPTPSDAKSESLDDYSITYAGSNAYPTKIVNMLDKWRRPVFA